MKTEEAIRRRLEASKFALAMKCQCAAEGHAYECHIGGRMMEASIGTLEWVLGLSPGEDRIEQELLTIVRRGGFHNT